ncbi:hypothetical protein [Nocardiopsis trehalosi]|uniref:hypothetical protein n=1 Tax=Nocardiopsis trehalosi TaxID=109329 RepID=UPI0008356699|nr:hypothetical protein [Nocardiopsis trehalosi]
MGDHPAVSHGGSTYLGWRHDVPVPDPGPPPRRPAPADRAELGPDWVDLQRRSAARTNKPLHIALAVLAAIAALCVLLWPLRVLPGVVALGGVLGCVLVTVPVLVALAQGRQVVRDRLRRERERLEREQREHEDDLRRRQEEHARAYTAWRDRRRAFEAQPRWYGTKVPAHARAVVVAGGTDAGWSALLTTIGASRLRSGGDLTVVDLSGRAVAGDLASLVKRCGVAPRVWVLPADLPRMNLGTNLGAAQRARILAAVARAPGGRGDPAADRDLLLGLLEALGPDTNVAALIGGLRALDGAAPADDPAVRLLTPDQRTAVRARWGGDRSVLERAWDLERRLAPFEGVGTRAAEEPYAQVKVIATDRASGGAAARAYGTYTAASLSELLELRARGRAPAAGDAAWAHTIIVCGADTLPDDEVDRLTRAAAAAGAGLVLLFRAAADGLDARLDAEGTLPVLMRQPDPDSADRAAARLTVRRGAAPSAPVHRLTEVIGEALSDAVADSYVEDPAVGVTAPVAMRNAATSVAPLDLVRHVRAASAWGRTTAQAEDIDTAPATGAPREHRLDARGMRLLPPTALVLPGPRGPVVADANPGILTLATATLATVEQTRAAGGPAVPPPAPAPDAESADTDDPPPNLGPPPERLDWRTA